MAATRRIISSPAKIILFGEWAVMHGHVGIASAIEAQLSCAWTGGSGPNQLGKDNPSFIFRSQEGIALWDPLLPLSKQKHIPNFFSKTVAFFEALIRNPTKNSRSSYFDSGGEFNFRRDWPLEWGLGSSSAVLACFLELAFPEMSLPEKWALGRSVLQKTTSPNASALDLASQLKGGTVYLKDHKPMGTLLDLPEEICFLHAGDKADTTEWIKSKNPAAQQLKLLGQSAANFLESKDWQRAIEEHASVLSEMDVWPTDLRKLREEWTKSQKVLAMKSCGSGGGDCWMLLVEKEKFEALKEETLERGYKLARHKISESGVSEISEDSYV